MAGGSRPGGVQASGERGGAPAPVQAFQPGEDEAQVRGPDPGGLGGPPVVLGVVAGGGVLGADRPATGPVTVDVTDTGPYAPPSGATPSGHGIPGMRERAATYGGTLRTGPLPDGGWGVHTRLNLGGSGVVSA
ncbi:hypothetical protein ABTX81_03345 [Kitasatospora sp. NPDC097605]|uniref:hypothetical protein n=1 Tax=Kitasatospora sp. NPDC097605 TaxID=3157226 RepID=UPI003330C5F9